MRDLPNMGEKERGKPDGLSVNVTRPQENAAPLPSSSLPVVTGVAAHTTKGMVYVVHSIYMTFCLHSTYYIQLIKDHRTQGPWPHGNRSYLKNGDCVQSLPWPSSCLDFPQEIDTTTSLCATLASKHHKTYFGSWFQRGKASRLLSAAFGTGGTDTLAWDIYLFQLHAYFVAQ